jgi:hypothetical protein
MRLPIAVGSPGRTLSLGQERSALYLDFVIFMCQELYWLWMIESKSDRNHRRAPYCLNSGKDFGVILFAIFRAAESFQ